MAWTDERVEQLKNLWAEGLSASQIANKMGGVTRNAVIGKVHRLGLSGRATPAQPVRGRRTATTAPEAKVEKQDAKTASIQRDIRKTLSAEPDFIAPLVLDTGDRTTVSTLNKKMCKWPIGDPTSEDFHFCGQSSAGGKSYCAYHAHMAFQPSSAKREKPKAAVLALPRRAAG